jgi:hypothetical protein
MWECERVAWNWSLRSAICLHTWSGHHPRNTHLHGKQKGHNTAHIRAYLHNFKNYLKSFYLLTYEAESFLRSCQMCSPSRTPQHIMEPEGSIPCSQEPSTGPILSHIHPLRSIPSYVSRIHFNIVHPPTSWSSQWSLSFRLSHQYPKALVMPLVNCIYRPLYIANTYLKCEHAIVNVRGIRNAFLRLP